MNQASLSVTHYLLGIGVAIAVFLIKEAITHATSGLRFRYRLVFDIKMMVQGHYGHLPELSRQKKQLFAALDALRSKGEADIGIAPIWDSEFNLLAEVYHSSSHLNKDALQDVAYFYDSVGRVEDIRKSYNEMLGNVVTSERPTIESLSYLDSCLDTLESNYLELINRGCKSLIVLSEKHWFLRVEVAHYRNIMTQISNQGSSTI